MIGAATETPIALMGKHGNVSLHDFSAWRQWVAVKIEEKKIPDSSFRRGCLAGDSSAGTYSLLARPEVSTYYWIYWTGE